MNPDTLRALISYAPKDLQEEGFAHADAWEAHATALANERDRAVEAVVNLQADIATLYQRLEQWEAEARDKANPQIRPMTAMENRYMDLEAELGAFKSDNDALRQRLEAARLAWNECNFVELDVALAAGEGGT